MIVYLARDIPAFVMYCVNGESGSSLHIESTDSMIYMDIIESVDSISRDEPDSPLTRYITHFKHYHRGLPLISNRISV